MNIFKKIQNVVKNRKTYRAGLLQARVYRAFKGYTQDKLSTYNISTIEWALLGLLADNQDGMRHGVLAEALGVESPFITVLVARLKKLKLIDVKADEKDSRAKIFYLTSKGADFVPKVETFLRDEMRPLVTGIPKEDLVTYLSVLEKINENSKTITFNKFKGFKDFKD